MYLLYNYLYGFAKVNMNHSPNPFSSHRVLCIFTKALQKGCGCTEMEMQVELAGTCRSFPFAKLILSPFPSNNWFMSDMSLSCFTSFFVISSKKPVPSSVFIIQYPPVAINLS